MAAFGSPFGSPFGKEPQQLKVKEYGQQNQNQNQNQNQSPFGQSPQKKQINGDDQKKQNGDDQKISHEFRVIAHFEDMEMELTVIDTVTKKSWKLIKTQKDYDDIKSMYSRIKLAVDQNKMNCEYPGIIYCIYTTL